MSYTKHNFINGDVLLAAQLNDIDNAIYTNDQSITTLSTGIYQDLSDIATTTTTTDSRDETIINIAQNFFAGKTIFYLYGSSTDASTSLTTTTYYKLSRVDYITQVNSNNETILTGIILDGKITYNLNTKVEFTSDFLNNKTFS